MVIHIILLLSHRSAFVSEYQRYRYRCRWCKCTFSAERGAQETNFQFFLSIHLHVHQTPNEQASVRAAATTSEFFMRKAQFMHFVYNNSNLLLSFVQFTPFREWGTQWNRMEKVCNLLQITSITYLLNSYARYVYTMKWNLILCYCFKPFQFEK